MSTARQALILVALAGLVLVVVPGCSSPTEPPDAVGPAQSYIDLVLGTSGELFAAQATRTEELIAACMAEQGFEYVPTTDNYFFVDDADIATPPGTREYAEQYGYGFAARNPDTSFVAVTDDANQAIRDAMSETELRVYEAALYGVPQGQPGEVIEQDEDTSSSDGGCLGRAQGATESGALTDGTYLALEDEVARIDAEVVPTDPKVVAADAAWSECMADAGHPGYARQPEAQERWMAHWSTTSPGGTGAFPGDPAGLTEAEKIVQAELVSDERALATADWDCADQVGYDDAIARVRDAAQQEYVDAHRDELDAWVEKWAEQ